ncbi:acetolactate synthase 2 small subunit [Parendozoicomonas haliclonae]|uniref:Acetolactate synthase isozyme 2 small subunit n=1 Tax=Parendozoicomonas haliclonae TaxID=1960125 RepID=A0A1X7ANK3_9GAMM|nr:acetolactate synthase 2 small subunit [Parendozoicomonas haliclonae]SMA49678.1 Acetolactate synthase isozyme 2 small subunit [Parendozoicomonas haliclonae]
MIKLDVMAINRQAVIERILRVVRHRGFHVCGLNMPTNTGSADVQVELTLERAGYACKTPVDQLVAQLIKLVDVVQVEQRS